MLVRDQTFATATHTSTSRTPLFKEMEVDKFM